MRRSLALTVCALIAACGGQTGDADVVTGEAISADGVPIRYEARGHGQPALVLVHGWTNDRSIWGPHVRTLADTHRVVALDLAGHGMSGAGRTDWTMEAFGRDVIAVVDDLGLEQVVLVGFSMGGAAVLEAAQGMPERVAGIIFVETFDDESRAVTPEVATQVEAMFRANWKDTAFVRAFAFTPGAPDSLVYALTDHMPDQPPGHWFAMMPRYAEWIQTEFEPTLRGIGAPVAAISTGRHPTDIAAMRELAPSFTLDTIAGVGHAGILLRRVTDFDQKLLAQVRRFSGEGG